MRKIIVALSLLAVIACKNKEENNSEPSIMEAADGVKNLNKAADALKDYEKKTEELKKLSPVSNAVFKQVLTDRLDDLPRTSYNAGAASSMGMSTAEANYGEVNTKAVKVTLLDGAGETGSAMLAIIHMTLAMDMESIEGTKTEQTEEFNEYRSLTQNNTDPNSYTNSKITFIYKERFQITFEGFKMQLDELKSYAKRLDLSQLDQ
ncbi:hypothetical protein [Flavobacterium algicola]|uniref:hypothetical protein n=1 Tax=Flavobacterium algicola TaxID=556529 RepID=UPI001EFCE4AD|nr:hypothetical protein [Flavobacterium algicola]MCG9791355.1 hypothetical protein [Flavobacterium algicola]